MQTAGHLRLGKSCGLSRGLKRGLTSGLAIALVLAGSALTRTSAESVKSSFDEAMKLYDADRFADAERVARALVTKSANDMAARLLLGWAQWSQARYDDALETFKAVLHEAPSYRRPTWEEYAAFALPREFLSIENPDLDAARSGLGWTYFKKGWPRSALAVFEGVVQHAPSWDQPRLGRGYAQLALGRLDEARADFNAYRALTKTRWLAERAFGDLEMAAGRPMAAIPYFEQALARKPHWRETEIELAWARAGGRPPLDHAWALYRAGHWTDAAAAFEALTKPSAPLPGDGRVSVLNGLGWSRLALKDRERAARAFGESLAAFPDGAEATAGVGWVALARKDWSGAEQAFAKASAAVPGIPSAAAGVTQLRRARYGSYDDAWALYWAGKAADARALFLRLRATPGDLPAVMTPFVRAGVAWTDLALHHPETAEPVFRELVSAGGEVGAEATAGLGWTALERQQFAEARRHFQAALGAAPGLGAATRGLAELRKREAPELDAAWTAYTARRYDEAAAAFERILARADLASHYRADAHRGHAWSLTWLGRPDEAAREFTTVTGSTPDADAWYGEGLALTRGGHPHEAIKPLRRALALAPRSVEIQTALGWALLKSGDPKGAEEAFLAAYALAPASAEVNRSVAWARVRANRVADALAPFRYALGETPAAVDDAEFRTLVQTKEYRPLKRDLGWAYARWHEFERARLIFEELLRDDRHDGDAAFGAGYTRYKLGRYAEAERYLERAIKASRPPGPRLVWVVFSEAGAYPILTDAWSIRGWVAIFRGDPTTARVRFSESLERDPELVSSLVGLGVALERMNDRGGAYEVYRRAAEIYPTYPLVVAGVRATEAQGASARGAR